MQVNKTKVIPSVKHTTETNPCLEVPGVLLLGLYTKEANIRMKVEEEIESS